MSIANCDECDQLIPGMRISNIHGVFCSKPCIDVATQRGYPKHIAESLDKLKDCLEEVRPGFEEYLSYQEKQDWRNQWQKALNDIRGYITGTKNGLPTT